MKTTLKHLISKIGNGLLVSIGFTLGIGIFGIIYAYTWTAQPNVGAGSGLTASAWNDMINNIGYLKENVDAKLATNGNGSALTGLTKSQVGLGNVDNTSDLNKPISTAVQAALNLKADSSSNCTKIPLYNKTTLLKTISCVVSSQTTILTTTCTPTYATFCDYRQMTTCTLFGYLCQ